ncbi:MAG: NAD(P)H-hydrate dehydratase [Oscillospiraceae bacterium]|nr:NAD(P)H-hydrate dehydratase [Oscillospiraceae bacterium]
MTHQTIPNTISLPTRSRDMHKGGAGKLLLIGGAVGYTGAPVLAAKAALRTGAGMVSVGVPTDIYPIVAGHLLEAMPFPLSCTDGKLNQAALPLILERLTNADVLLLGPGLGQSEELDTLVLALIRQAKIPMVLDADGLNALSRHIHVLDEAQAPIILTPHLVEFTRLGGDLATGDHVEAARGFATRHSCTLVLKGPGTVSAFSDGSAYVNQTGNPGMAVGGSGDVLAGMIAALIGQGLGLEQAVTTAVWAHGRAGDLAANRLGEYSLLPSDLIDTLPEVLVSITR